MTYGTLAVYQPEERWVLEKNVLAKRLAKTVLRDREERRTI